MKKPYPAVIMISLAMLAASPVLSLGADEIALYLDPGFTRNCIAPSPDYPLELTAYLVLHGCSADGGVGGWECLIRMDDSLTLLSSDFRGADVAIDSRGGYLATQSQPLRQKPDILLGTLKFRADGPGEIYLEAVRDGNSSNPLLPCFTDGGNSDRAIDLRYTYGSPLSPAATVGMENCPCDTFGPNNDYTHHPEWIEMDPADWDRGEFVVFSEADFDAGEPKHSYDVIDWDSWARNDACLTGTVLESKPVVILMDRKPKGAVDGMLRLDLEVKEMFWGPPLSRLTVYFRPVSIPGVIRYQSCPSAMSVESAEVLVLAHYQEGAFQTNRTKFFPVDSPSASCPARPPQDVYGGLPYLTRRSDLVVVTSRPSLTLPKATDDLSIPPGRIFVEEFIRGHCASRELTVEKHASRIRKMEEAHPGRPMLIFLQEINPGVYVPTQEYKGIYAVYTEGLVGAYGMLHPFQNPR